MCQLLRGAGMGQHTIVNAHYPLRSMQQSFTTWSIAKQAVVQPQGPDK